MDKGLELTNLRNEDLLELYKKNEEYIAFLEKEKCLFDNIKIWKQTMQHKNV